MSVAERDFNSFELGDNVYELAGCLIPEMAEIAGVDIGDDPNVEKLGQLVGKYGKEKVLRDNEPIDIPIETAADLVDRSGVQGALNRSLWTPNLIPDATDIVVTGGMANWQDRTIKTVLEEAQYYPGMMIHFATGNRVMDTKSEVNNPNIIEFLKRHGEYPTETDYSNSFVGPQLSFNGFSISGNHYYFDSGHYGYQTGNGDEIAKKFVTENQQLFKTGSGITFAKVANAGIQLACQFRKAVRDYVRQDFDVDPNNPEAFVLTDSFPVARSEEDLGNPAEFQSPFTALRQVALTAKLLHEAATE